MRVPVVTTHSLAVHAVFEREVTADAAREILRDAPGVVARRRPGARRVPDAGRRGRHRPDLGRAGSASRWTTRTALDLFVCGDNLRKGAALNTAQIAELVAAELDSGLKVPPTAAAWINKKSGHRRCSRRSAGQAGFDRVGDGPPDRLDPTPENKLLHHCTHVAGRARPVSATAASTSAVSSVSVSGVGR